eukprot:TRINITY_DN503_c0_g1_i2.p1 TRINITY_DN503_c0_g1~~TRINITY_DN503_c0_g1_i2.p1  ORF type:complete len:226 (-),score=21.43 TRINITY_DN503_c0_g1_i2:235-912(-)
MPLRQDQPYNSDSESSLMSEQQQQARSNLSSPFYRKRDFLSFPSVRKLVWRLCRHLLRDVRKSTQSRQYIRRIGSELVEELAKDADTVGYLYEDLVQGGLSLVNLAIQGLVTDVKVCEDQVQFTVKPVKAKDVDKFCYQVIKLARQVDQASDIDFVLVSSKLLSEVQRSDYLNWAPELTPYQADKIAEVLLTLPQEVSGQFPAISSVQVRSRAQDNNKVGWIVIF